MVTIPPRDGEEEEVGEEEELGDREEVEGEEGGPALPTRDYQREGPAGGGAPPGREVRPGGFLFCLCFWGFCLVFVCFRCAGVPRHNGRILPRRATVRWGQDFGGGEKAERKASGCHGPVGPDAS